jgi:hypothetical protein
MHKGCGSQSQVNIFSTYETTSGMSFQATHMSDTSKNYWRPSNGLSLFPYEVHNLKASGGNEATYFNCCNIQILHILPHSVFTCFVRLSHWIRIFIKHHLQVCLYK